MGASSISFPHLTYQSLLFPETNIQRPEEKVGLTNQAHTDYLQYRYIRRYFCIQKPYQKRLFKVPISPRSY